MPPRYKVDGTCVQQDRVAGFSAHFDVLDEFGRALVVHAFAESVLIAFERAIALIRRTSRFHRTARKTPTPSLPSVYYDTSCHVQRIISFSSQTLKSRPSLLAITLSSTLLCINVHQEKYRAITYSVLDNFLMQHGLPTIVSCSTDDKYALVGFDSGVIKVIEIDNPARKQTLCMRESVDILAANQKYVIASSSIQPITLCVWKLSNGSCVHNITQQSEGWNRIHTIAAIQPLANPSQFYVWTGLHRLFVLDVSTGSIVQNVLVHPRFIRVIRSAVEEAEHGAGSAHIGACKLALFSDEKSLALATSNRVFVVSPSSNHLSGKIQKQFDGVRGALVALSTDERLVVTAEGNAFGGLGVHVSGRASLATLPRLQVWNVEDEKLSSEIQLPSAATSLSVCADVVAVVCGAVGKAVVVFAGGL
ncbi:WD40/YVTN repeat-like containing protein [Gracilaria domingensis]|nr:WD40/YVTN repeat-like containing protein [Gracilaria domingensis]